MYFCSGLDPDGMMKMKGPGRSMMFSYDELRSHFPYLIPQPPILSAPQAAEEDVVAYVRAGDLTNQDWDDWPLRMTYRINWFLRANRDDTDPDIDLLNAF